MDVVDLAPALASRCFQSNVDVLEGLVDLGSPVGGDGEGLGVLVPAALAGDLDDVPCRRGDADSGGVVHVGLDALAEAGVGEVLKMGHCELAEDDSMV